VRQYRPCLFLSQSYVLTGTPPGIHKKLQEKASGTPRNNGSIFFSRFARDENGDELPSGKSKGLTDVGSQHAYGD
jgi:hypothetical protein